jgi:hypothetical protein
MKILFRLPFDEELATVGYGRLTASTRHVGNLPSPSPNPQNLLKNIKACNSTWPSLQASWVSLPIGSFKVNFDVAVRSRFSVVLAVLGNHEGWIVTTLILGRRI